MAVARFRGKVAMHIFEQRAGYYAVLENEFMKPINVPYYKARKLNTQEEEDQGDATDILFSALRHACEIFEEEYFNQVSNILEALGIKEVM